MADNVIVPVIDQSVIQEKVNEFALAGAVKAIENYYSGYNSPYQKEVEKQLGSFEIGSLKLPDVLSIINDGLSKEIDKIANEAIAKTFLPLVSQFLLRAEKQMSFSQILRKFISETGAESMEDVEIECKLDERYSWWNVFIFYKEKQWDLTLHCFDYTRKQGEKKTYHLLSIPRTEGKGVKEVMKVSLDGATLEMPFTRDILSDGFASFIARLVLANTEIFLDTTEFTYDMFPDRCHCH